MIKTEIANLEDSQVKISVEIPVDELLPFKEKALNHLNNHTNISGFRPGHIPSAVLEKKIGEEKIWQEIAEEAISHFAPQVIQEQKLNIIGRPEVVLTKLAPGNPLGFTITVTTLPEITLPDYLKIAKEVQAKFEKPAAPTDEEMTTVLEELRKSRAVKTEITNPPTSNEETKEAELILPELNDEFAKLFGPFETLEDLKSKIKENLQAEKEFETKEKKRLAILEAIAEKVALTVPAMLIKHEKHKMLHELEYEVSKMGLKIDDYLKHIKKTKEELTENWTTEATKRVKLGLVTNAIIESEKITASTEEIDNTTTSLLLRAHSDKEPSKEEMLRLRSYAENSIIHDKVWEVLDK